MDSRAITSVERDLLEQIRRLQMIEAETKRLLDKIRDLQIKNATLEKIISHGDCGLCHVYPDGKPCTGCLMKELATLKEFARNYKKPIVNNELMRKVEAILGVKNDNARSK